MKKFILLVLALLQLSVPNVMAENSNFTGAVPEDGAVEVELDTRMSLFFSDAVDQESLSSAVFELNGDREYIRSVSVEEENTILLELEGLDEGTTYTLQFSGVLCGGEPTWGKTSFTTGFEEAKVIQIFENETIADYYSRHLGAKSVSTENNVIQVTTEKSCSIFSSEMALSPTEVKVISFTMKSEKDFQGALYFSSEQYSGFSNDKVYEFHVSAGDYQTYVLSMGELETWNEMEIIKGLRLTQLDNISNQFEISTVAFMNRLPEGKSELQIGNLSLKKNYGTEEEEDITNGQLSAGDVTAVLDVVHNPLEERQKALLVIAYYEGNGMKDIQCVWIGMEPGETKYAVSVGVQALSETGRIKAFVRKGLTDITPLKTCVSAG